MHFILLKQLNNFDKKVRPIFPSLLPPPQKEQIFHMASQFPIIIFKLCLILNLFSQTETSIQPSRTNSAQKFSLG